MKITTEAAMIRIGKCLNDLKKFSRRSATLQETARAVVAANELLSALSKIYDDLYELSEGSELINRTCKHPLPVEDVKV